MERIQKKVKLKQLFNLNEYSLRIVLVQPAGEINVGSIARIMKNFDLMELVIVNPECDHLSKSSCDMAVHAKDVLYSAKIRKSLSEALEDCVYVIATTVKSRIFGGSLEVPQEILPNLLKWKKPTALLFGPENRGLSNEELKWAQSWIKIPTSEEYPTLNLAQAVAICCYELFKLSGELSHETKNQEAASINEMNNCLDHFEQCLLDIGYIYPHTANSRMEKFRHLLFRANPTKHEMNMLRGVFSQIKWATSQK